VTVTGATLDVWKAHREVCSQDKAEEELYRDIPCWELDLSGNLLRANLLALWMWKLPIHDTPAPVSVLEVYADNASRIPIDQADNRTFWRAKFKIAYHFYRDAPTPLDFARAADPRLESLWQEIRAEDSLEGMNREHTLIVLPIPDGQLNEPWAFQPSTAAVTDAHDQPSGYLCSYGPCHSVYDIITEKYKKFQESGQPYVLDMNRKEGEAHSYLTPQGVRTDTVASGVSEGSVRFDAPKQGTRSRSASRDRIDQPPIEIHHQAYPLSLLDELAQDPPPVYRDVAERVICANLARREALAREELNFLRRSSRLVRDVAPNARKG
jgi:hypothetical protein